MANKINLFRLNIISIGYIYNKPKTTCIIQWRNPLTDQIITTRASAKHNEKDQYSMIFGKRLAESRCKMIMYRKYAKILFAISSAACAKHRNLARREMQYQTNIINK